MIGETIDSYTVTAVIAQGASGDLLVARQAGSQVDVAIRLLPAAMSADRALVQKCFDEASKAGGLSHSGVARVLYTGFHGDRAFLALDHVPGELLSARMTKGRMSSTQVADLARKLADVLASAHAAGIQHRDLRSERVVIVTDADGREGVRVLDFGVANLEPTPTSVAAATYAAPERWTNPGAVGVLADMYSLGAIAFEMATGKVPFAGHTVDELRAQHLSAPPPAARGVMPDIPAALEHLVMKMMAKAPGERPDKMVDVVRAFQVLGGGALATSPLATTEAFQEVLQAPTVAHGTGAKPEPIDLAPKKPTPPTPAPIIQAKKLEPTPVPAPRRAEDAGSTMQMQRKSGGPTMMIVVIGLVVAIGVAVAILLLGR